MSESITPPRRRGEPTGKYRLRAGLCYACGAQPAAGRRRCAACHDRQVAYYHSQYQAAIARRRKAGLCQSCGHRPSRPNRVTCTTCAEKMRGYDEKRRKAGVVCGVCRSRARTIGTLCDVCHPKVLDRSAAVREKRLALGLCRLCGKRPPAPLRQACFGCIGRRYGGSHEELEALWAGQQCRCAICGDVFQPSKKGAYAVDHSHDRGGVRGFLCAPCNAGLGAFRESERRFLEAMAYLRRHNALKA